MKDSINIQSFSPIQSLEENIIIMLSQLRINFNKVSLIKNVAVSFLVEDFGLAICCIDRVDYAQTSSIAREKFPGWRLVFITTNDNISEKRYDVIWSLMRCGYMKWLRYTYPRQIKSILNGPDNLGTLIIKERLRIWNNLPKFKFLIEDNKFVLVNGIQREFVNDPSFFDYMPEEEVF